MPSTGSRPLIGECIKIHKIFGVSGCYDQTMAERGRRNPRVFDEMIGATMHETRPRRNISATIGNT